jgi:3-hydroxyacyl-[acyl-carrier-protein] dehydratase
MSERSSVEPAVAENEAVDPAAAKNTPMEIREILCNLPHRYPLLMIDRLLEMEGERARGLKQLSINEWFFQGHFPDEPEMPASLLLESMGQAGAAAVLARPENKGKLLFLVGIDNVEFQREAYPGQTLTMDARFLRNRGDSGRTEVICKVNGELLAKAEYTFVLSQPDEVSG